MVGFCFTSKKSLPFNFPFFMPLPVSTLSAWILISRTPVDTSGDLKVSEASHLLNLPTIATDASTSNLIELSAGVTLKTGTPSLVWARLTHENIIDSKITGRLSFIVGGLLLSELRARFPWGFRWRNCTAIANYSEAILFMMESLRPDCSRLTLRAPLPWRMCRTMRWLSSGLLLSGSAPPAVSWVFWGKPDHRSLASALLPKRHRASR